MIWPRKGCIVEQMDDLSREYVITFFERELERHGDRPEALRWTAEGQRRHYEALLDIGDIRGRRILDFGCGKGDLYQYLADRSIPVEYSGVDINARLISCARRKFPKADFRVLDLDVEDIDSDYDYIFLCGVFNLEICGIDEAVCSTLSRLFRHCRNALAFNALSSYESCKGFELHYTNPGALLDFAVKNLSPFVSLRHDRMRYDFTLFVYRSENVRQSAHT